MGRLKCLPPLLKTAAPQMQSYRSGDDRIRGNSLQVIRRRILARDCGVCQCDRCKASGEVRLATIVDHKVPLWAGGAESDDNRQAINAECHDLKSADEARMRAAGGYVPP